MYDASELVYALEEEIGHTELFTGRKKELNYLFGWTAGVKNKLKKSIALKTELQPHLKTNTGFIFYSYKSLSQKLVDLLKDHDIMIMYGEKKA